MYGVVQHENGRIDAEDLKTLAMRGLALVRAGMQAPRYVLLHVDASQTVACRMAEELRRERRERIKAIGGGL